MNNVEEIKPKPEIKRVEGYLGQRYQIIGFKTLTDEPDILGWSDENTGGGIKFKGELNPLYKEVLVVDLQANPRALANGFFIYQSKKDKTTKYEVLDYGLLKYKNMATFVVITSQLPPPLADAEVVQDFMSNPRTVVMERRDFFTKHNGIG